MLYGRQQGEQIGYNPHKPGRPSHVYHSYFVATLRISLGVEVRPGKEHAGAQGLPGLWQMWNLYVRFFDEAHHREAITSRPALMQGVARQVQSGGQRTIKVSLLHEYREDIAVLVGRTSRQLQQMSRITERWSVLEKWTLKLTRLLRHWLGGKWLPGLPSKAALFLSG